MWQEISNALQKGDTRALARAISLVENETGGYESLLQSLPAGHAPVIGITGPPGAGKSTITDGLIGQAVEAGKKVAVLCVDPSSAFHHGALLGDRIRMSSWYTHPQVFIRSLATRGALGGLHPKMLEITDLLKAAGFDEIIVETVGVGQTEVEIAGLADVTVVVLVPEAGDDVQAMKAGLMEIADLFVINKSDRPDADVFLHHVKQMLHESGREAIAVVKTVAHQQKGIPELRSAVEHLLLNPSPHKRKSWLLAERAYWLISAHKMKGLHKAGLQTEIEDELKTGVFNLYRFVMQKM